MNSQQDINTGMNDKQRILLLAANAGDAELSERALRRLGMVFESMRVESESAFTTALATFCPDLILANEDVADFDCLRALAQARAYDHNLPFIILSASMDETRVTQSLQNGADDYTCKDRLESLAMVVRRALELRARNREIDRLQAEHRFSEERFLAVSNSIRDAFILIDANGTVLEWNSAAVAMFGYNRDEVIGRYMHQLIAPGRYHQAIDDGMAKLRQSGTGEAIGQTLELVAKHRDGHAFPIELSLSAMRLGDQWQAIGLVRDISTRKLAEQAAYEREARMGSIFRAAPIGIGIVSNPERTLLDVNDRVCEITGYKRSELIGKNARILYTSDAEYEAVGREKYHQIDSKGMGTVETRFRRKDGTIIDVILSSSPLDPSDYSAGVTFTVMDITRRKSNESIIALQAHRAEVLLELPRIAEAMEEIEFMQHGLQLAEDLTGSEISFFHFVNDDESTIELVAWSRRTLEHMCTAAFDQHYPVRQAGVWADAVRQRRPVVINDYASYPNRQGVPDGHAELRRLISVPLIEHGKVVMVAGVGNKANDYTELDVETLQLVSNEIWSIAQRRRFVASLRANEARYRELVENMSDGVALYEAVDHGRDFVFREHNTAGEMISKTPRAQVIGRRVTEVYPGIESMGLLDVFRRVWQTGEPEAFLSSVYQDKHLELWVDNYVFRLPSGELVAVYKDISERKHAEVALQESESRLRALIDTMPDLVWLKDPQGVYLACNPKFERLYNAVASEIIGKTDYDFVNADLADFFREKDQAAIAAGKLTVNEELLMFADDGHEELVETIKTPMYNADGELIGVLGISRDITAHKRTERELAAQLAELKRWQDVTLGRELRGLELKREINSLLHELGRPPRYPSALEDGVSDD